ncbi:hypothetical protein FOA52_000863 [Chlamydomonas sp. UWO 241]|nr:hypothetical protein FOA52_000863 [Chlamydomonas sp. UWO 241]
MANVPEPPRERLFDETLSWSSDELSRIRQLKERDLENKTAFLESSSVADFLGLHHVDAVHMPIPLSIVLIGFSGDGNLGVNLSLAQVQKWFGHLDHVLPHSRIELAELSCTEDGQCTGLVHGHAPNTQPVHSTVHLNFSCNAVLVKQRSVVAAFERAVHAFGRPVDIDVESGTQQVDAVKMEAFVDHFVTSLGLSSHYTLVVLNPSWSSSEAAYGYRAGLSQSEIDVVVREKAEVMRLLQTTGDAEPSLGPADAGRAWGDVGWRRPAQPALDSKFATNDMTWRSNEWASRANEYLGQEEAFREKMTKSIRGARKGVGAMVHGARVLRRLTGHLGTTMRYEVMGDTAYTHAKLRSRFATHHPATDCLVGNWVSTKQRWLLLDLSATAGSEWGPAMGGDGVVHEHTVPRVATYFGPLADKRKLMRKAARVEGSVDHEMQKKLSAEKTDTLARTSKEEYAAFVARRKEWDEARKSGEGDSGASVKDELEKWGKTYRQALARAELDMFEKFALRHCHNQAPPLPLCADIKDDVSRLRSQLSKLVVSLGTPDNNSSDGSDDSGGCGGSGGLFPSHMWDIFGAGAALPHVEAGDVGEAASRARDFFTADLVSVLSRGLRHVVAPPTAVWRHGTGGAGSGSGGKMDGQWVRHDIAMPFASRVTFQVTLISESTKVRTHSETALFDIKAFEHQVRRLALTNPAGTHSAQAFDFKVRTHQLSSEPDLAAAFAVSLRSAYHAISDGSAAFGTGAEVLYVDSRELQHHVRSALAARSEWPVRERAPGHTVVPVLIFQLDRDAAVLIDQHYNAKLLSAARKLPRLTTLLLDGAAPAHAHMAAVGEGVARIEIGSEELAALAGCVRLEALEAPALRILPVVGGGGGSRPSLPSLPRLRHLAVATLDTGHVQLSNLLPALTSLAVGRTPRLDGLRAPAIEAASGSGGDSRATLPVPPPPPAAAQLPGPAQQGGVQPVPPAAAALPPPPPGAMFAAGGIAGGGVNPAPPPAPPSPRPPSLLEHLGGFGGSVRVVEVAGAAAQALVSECGGPSGVAGLMGVRTLHVWSLDSWHDIHALSHMLPRLDTLSRLGLHYCGPSCAPGRPHRPPSALGVVQQPQPQREQQPGAMALSAAALLRCPATQLLLHGCDGALLGALQQAAEEWKGEVKSEGGGGGRGGGRVGMGCSMPLPPMPHAAGGVPSGGVRAGAAPSAAAGETPGTRANGAAGASASTSGSSSSSSTRASGTANGTVNGAAIGADTGGSDCPSPSALSRLVLIRQPALLIDDIADLLRAFGAPGHGLARLEVRACRHVPRAAGPALQQAAVESASLGVSGGGDSTGSKGAAAQRSAAAGRVPVHVVVDSVALTSSLL